MKNKGFTLIELMIVVAIIAIIAAIAIPNLLRSRLSANEASAIGSMRTVGTAQASYQSSGLKTDTNGTGQYGTLTELGSETPPFIDNALSGGTKAGYSFSVTTTATGPAFNANATPVSPDTTGVRLFFLDESGVLRFTADGSAATSGSTALN